MNYKLNSYLSILAITCAVAVPLLSATARELPVQAALSAPASWNIKYAHDGFEFGITNPSNNTSNNYLSYPEYTRTADGIYYNYNVEIDSNDTSIIPEGFVITHTFNRSNTSWTLGVGSTYQAVDTKIGSDSSIGTIYSKVDYTFDNQTNKDYFIYMDMASSSGNRLMRISYDGVLLTNANDNTHPYYDGGLQREYIPAYSEFKWYSYTTGLDVYFDAWYLQDLGISASYDAGYDAGYDIGEADGYEDGLGNNPNILINAAESLIGMFVNFTFILFSLELFGVSVLTVVGVLFGIVAIVWILKTIRG
jgi:hypothetical protein